MQGPRLVLPASWSKSSTSEEAHGAAGPSERGQPSGFGSPLPNFLGTPKPTELSLRNVQAPTGPGSPQLGGITRY
jgi:hypothetical protein